MTFKIKARIIGSCLDILTSLVIVTFWFNCQLTDWNQVFFSVVVNDDDFSSFIHGLENFKAFLIPSIASLQKIFFTIVNHFHDSLLVSGPVPVQTIFSWIGTAFSC